MFLILKNMVMGLQQNGSRRKLNEPYQDYIQEIKIFKQVNSTPSSLGNAFQLNTDGRPYNDHFRMTLLIFLATSASSMATVEF